MDIQDRRPFEDLSHNRSELENSLCKSIDLEDNKLLNLHYKRLSNSDLYHQDPAQTILTQDFIYACVQHLKPSKSIITQEVEFLLEEADFEDYVVKDSDPNLNGSFVNFEKILNSINFQFFFNNI